MDKNFLEKSETIVGIDSPEALFADKFKQEIEAGTVDTSSLNNDEAFKEALLNSSFKRHPKFKSASLDGIIAELKKNGVIKPIVVEKKLKPKKEIEHIKTNVPKIELTSVEVDEKTKEDILNSVREFEKAGIFKNDSDFESVYNKALSLEKNKSLETIEYYNEFAKAGLLKRGEEEAMEDWDALEERKKDFKDKESTNPEERESFKKAKKIATITELGLAYSVSELGLCGEKITFENTCGFDDVKRGVDGLLEINKEDDESSFLGLGIDVTYRGLYSEQFKSKFFNLLHSINNGYKTKVKYFKNHEGKMMKEFSVPKTILYFNINDVKSLVYMIKNIDDPKTKEEFKKNFKKFNVLKQIINQCDKLAAFAEESRNDIFKKYIEIKSSITELSWDNPEIAEIIKDNSTDEISQHMDKLIKEFKKEQEKSEDETQY